MRKVALYEAEVRWSDQDATDRAGAFRQALRQVLVKVTGLRRFADTARIETPGRERARTRAAVPVTYGERWGTAKRARRSRACGARFDEGAVDRLVREAGLPEWGRTRPSVLAWIAADNDGTLLMVGSEGTEGLAEILRRGAASRGVSLALPLLES